MGIPLVARPIKLDTQCCRSHKHRNRAHLVPERPTQPQHNGRRTRPCRYVLSFCDASYLVVHHGHSASVIAVHRLTGSLINTCYDRKLRSDRNASVDLNPTIDYLRSLVDVLHRLYTIATDEDSNGHPLSSPTSNPNGLLVKCTTELHVLQRILETANWPLRKTDLTNTLDNLHRIKAELDAHGRSVYSSILMGTLIVDHFLAS
jgi:hypothetical protein